MSDENKILSKSAQSVQQTLAEKGLVFEVSELSSSTRTANDAANSIGCAVAQIIKIINVSHCKDKSACSSIGKRYQSCE